MTGPRCWRCRLDTAVFAVELFILHGIVAVVAFFAGVMWLAGQGPL